MREVVRLGMQGDETSQRLANEVIQTELWNLLTEQSEEAIEEQASASKSDDDLAHVWDVLGQD
jgi:hypothetical protein